MTDTVARARVGGRETAAARAVGGVRRCEAAGRRPSRFIVEPRLDARLSHASTSHASPFGPIAVRWTREADGGRIHVDVPAGTEAELRLPDGFRETLSPGAHQRVW